MDKRQTPEISPSQQVTIDRLVSLIADQNSRVGLTEQKRFELTQFEDSPIIFMTIEYGMPNDEGTSAAVFARDFRHIMIGKNGGCELMNPKKKGRTINRGLYHCSNNLPR
jgi:hypothetical protein